MCWLSGHSGYKSPRSFHCPRIMLRRTTVWYQPLSSNPHFLIYISNQIQCKKSHKFWYYVFAINRKSVEFSNLHCKPISIKEIINFWSCISCIMLPLSWHFQFLFQTKFNVKNDQFWSRLHTLLQLSMHKYGCIYLHLQAENEQLLPPCYPRTEKRHIDWKRN